MMLVSGTVTHLHANLLHCELVGRYGKSVMITCIKYR